MNRRAFLRLLAAAGAVAAVAPKSYFFAPKSGWTRDENTGLVFPICDGKVYRDGPHQFHIDGITVFDDPAFVDENTGYRIMFDEREMKLKVFRESRRPIAYYEIGIGTSPDGEPRSGGIWLA